MLTRRLKALAALLSLSLLVLGVSMCGGSSKDPPKSTDEGVPKVTLSASPDKLAADGATTDITVQAVQADGTNGNGTVDLQATNGSLNGGGTSVTVTLSNGRASAKWNCDAAKTAACVGNQTLTATWAAKTATTAVEFTSPGTAVVDAGTDASTDASSDSPSDAPTDSPAPVPGTIVVAASKPKIFVGTNDFSTLTATVKRLDGGPIANEPVSFSTDLGALGVGADASADAQVFAAVTAANGTAQVDLRDQGTLGTATVTVTRPATAQMAQTQVAIQAAQQISWVSTKCKGVNCTILGTKGSGFNDSATVTFKVVDGNNNPITNVLVTFSIVSPPTGTTVTASGRTDAAGLVTTTITPGLIVGTFAVTASVDVPSTDGGASALSIDSPSIGLRGALPTNKGFTFFCSPRVNVDAYSSPTPPLAVSVGCTVKLVDRYGQSVGSGTAVSFKTEAGTLPSSVGTQVFVVGGNNTAEGTAPVTFNTTGVFPPLDVDPLEALAVQYPNVRDQEPRYTVGQLVRNPRDGLVSLLAYVKGEEWFSDDNNNGVHDPAEQFVDQGEPFVDANDNGTRDVGEDYVDVDGNLSWDGPNGTWDSSTTVWAETRLLYTGTPVLTNSMVAPATFGPITPPATQKFSAYFRDVNLNYISAQGAVVTTAVTATKGSAPISQPLADRYGMDLQRLIVASAGEGACLPATPVCKFKYVFLDWAGTNSLSSVNATYTAAGLAGPSTVSFTATINANVFTISSVGSVGP